MILTTNKSQTGDIDRNAEGGSPNRSSSPSVSPPNRDQLTGSLEDSEMTIESSMGGEGDSRLTRSGDLRSLVESLANTKSLTGGEISQPSLSAPPDSSLYSLDNFEADINNDGTPPQDPVVDQTVSKSVQQQSASISQVSHSLLPSGVAVNPTITNDPSAAFGAPLSLNKPLGGSADMDSFEYFVNSVSHSAPSNSVMSGQLTKSESARGALSGLHNSSDFGANSSDEIRLHHSLSGILPAELDLVCLFLQPFFLDVYSTTVPSAGSASLGGLGVSLDSAATDWQAAFGFKSTSVPVTGGTSMMEKLFQLDQNNSDVSELLSSGSAGQFRPSFLRSAGGNVSSGLDSLNGSSSVPSSNGNELAAFAGVFMSGGNKTAVSLSGGGASLVENSFHVRFSSDADDLGRSSEEPR